MNESSSDELKHVYPLSIFGCVMAELLLLFMGNECIINSSFYSRVHVFYFCKPLNLFI